MALVSDVILKGLFADLPSDNTALTTGRLYFSTDTDALYRDNGTTWDAMVVGGGSSPLVLEAKCLDAQSLTSSTWTDVNFDEVDGTFLGHFDQSDTTKLVADSAAAGLWRIQAFAVFDCIGGGAIGQICYAILYLNGSTVIARASQAIDGNTSTQVVTFPKLVTLSDTDILTLQVRHTAGTTIDLHSNTTDAWSGLTLEKLN